MFCRMKEHSFSPHIVCAYSIIASDVQINYSFRTTNKITKIRKIKILCAMEKTCFRASILFYMTQEKYDKVGDICAGFNWVQVFLFVILIILSSYFRQIQIYIRYNYIFYPPFYQHFIFTQWGLKNKWNKIMH